MRTSPNRLRPPARAIGSCSSVSWCLAAATASNGAISMLDLLRTGPTNARPAWANARVGALACCLAAMVVALGSAGCAGKAVRKRGLGMVAELIKALPGSYDNLAQVRGEGGSAEAGAPLTPGASQTVPGA